MPVVTHEAEVKRTFHAEITLENTAKPTPSPPPSRFRHPPFVSWPAIIGAVLYAGIVGLVFGVQPARNAACLHPVEALRA